MAGIERSLNTWFTGDTHFGSKRTLELSRRPFATDKEMDRIMISNWNSVVRPNDTIYHVGDFGDYEISHQLNGKIHLLFGNYERDDIHLDNVTLHDLRNKFNFASVNIGSLLHIEEFNIDLVHEPKARRNNFTLFGHIHKLQMVKRNALNVGVDCHNFMPIDFGEVLFYKNAIQNHYDHEVFSI